MTEQHAAWVEPFVKPINVISCKEWVSFRSIHPTRYRAYEDHCRWSAGYVRGLSHREPFTFKGRYRAFGARL